MKNLLIAIAFLMTAQNASAFSLTCKANDNDITITIGEEREGNTSGDPEQGAERERTVLISTPTSKARPLAGSGTADMKQINLYFLLGGDQVMGNIEATHHSRALNLYTGTAKAYSYNDGQPFNVTCTRD